MTDQRFDIQEFISALSEIPNSDLLVHLNEQHKRLLALPNELTTDLLLDNSELTARILKETKQFQKEADINTLAVANGIIEWKDDERLFQSPIFLIPCQWSFVKTTQQVQLTLLAEQTKLNPVIAKQIKEWSGCDFVLPEDTAVQDCMETFQQFCISHQLQVTISSTNYLGNFHYHRFHLLRELEGIAESAKTSELIQALLGEATPLPAKITLTEQLLTPSDNDQSAVFSAFQENNIVIQGPPGTGKSQVLTNLLGKLLAADKKTVVVSEKKAALAVLVKQLAVHGLATFAVLVHNQLRARDFIAQLKHSWEFLEANVERHTAVALTSHQRIAQLQQLLDRLNAADTIGGISFSKYLMLVEETPFQEVVLHAGVVSLDNWLSIKESVQKIEQKIGGLSLLKGFKPAFFNEFSGDTILDELSKLTKKLGDLFSAKKYADFVALYEAIGRCQLIENESYKVFSTIINKPSEWKRFEQHLIGYRQIDAVIKSKESELKSWKTIPTESQYLSWIQSTGTIRNFRKKRAIKKLLIDKTIQIDVALNQYESYRELIQKKAEYTTYFLSLGLTNDSSELEINYTYAKLLRKSTKETLKTVASWPIEKRQLLLAHSSNVNQFISLVNRFFIIDETTEMSDFVLGKQQDIVSLIPIWKELQDLPSNFYHLLVKAETSTEIQAYILAANWSITTARFPELTQFNGKQLADNLQQIVIDQDREMADFGRIIITQQRKKFQQYEGLLRKSTQQCSPDEKILRATLKKGKALLVKEFAKSRTHATIRELLASDAAIWIDLLCPIWLSSPNQIADHFPLQANLFDVVLFDEASQLTLPNALGALYRSNRAVVAGDSQQMSPTTFFGRNWEGHDLLHQARYYFTNCSLTHHYRSSDPALIAFSNRYFYNNKLMAYPSPLKQPAINYYFIENAAFKDRKNAIEAQQIGEKLQQIDWSKQIGIIAFSEQQLAEIWSACSLTVQQKITDGIENNTVFFKSLENVQGDEAEIVFISLGYGKDENGVFAHRFGPLNHANGYKRLNVLLTRAKEQLHFFSSVTANDFSLSTNESVNLLRRFLMEIETYSANQSLVFPHDLTPIKIVENQLFLQQIYASITDANEMTTFHRVMKSRGWQLNYV